jgi:hypothetical protein
MCYESMVVEREFYLRIKFLTLMVLMLYFI